MLFSLLLRKDSDESGGLDPDEQRKQINKYY